MVLTKDPSKGRTQEEIVDLGKKYKVGDEILPKVEAKEKSLRERRVEDEDRRLMEEVRGLSLREVGVGSPVEGSAERRERRRLDEARSHISRSQQSRDHSRDDRHRDSRSGDDRERRRRRDIDSERRRERDDTALRPEIDQQEERRRRRSNEEASRRHEETRRSAARQIEHQSSLRSLLSSSDVDSHEMEEEILRQIREEGLLDGIDLENIDVNQEDQISERIAEAFKRRQEEKAREERDRKRSNNRRRQARNSAANSRETSGDESRTSRRGHTRTVSAVSQSDQQSRPPPSISASQANHLDVHSSDEGRRRRRTTSGTRSSTTPVPVAEALVRPAARSTTDLSDATQAADISNRRPLTNSRSATDPSIQHTPDNSAADTTTQPLRSRPDTSPRTSTAARMEGNLVPRPLSQSHWPPVETVGSSTYDSSLAVVTSPVDQTLVPPPLSPSHSSNPSPHRSPNHSPHASLSDRATALSSGTRPTSSSSATHRQRAPLFPEPSIDCARCLKSHIEYELHYNCVKCHGGNYNICLSCFRNGAGCLHWFGFGNSAWTKWENLIHSGEIPSSTDRPHMLYPSRYVPPTTTPGGAEGRKTLTTQDPTKRLQTGVFCANCLTWANECYWRCESCNEGDWGFCNNCVNQSKSCTHALLPLTYRSPDPDTSEMSPSSRGQLMPPSATILTGPDVTSIGHFQPLTFSTKCDICHRSILPTSNRYHCPQCISNVPNTLPGDYDICTTCYPRLMTSRRISPENGGDGWRRCLEGHRMLIIGFEKSYSGQRRIIISDLIGGHLLKCEQFPHSSFPDLAKWSWGETDQHSKLVTNNVMNTPPSHFDEFVQASGFPAEGGTGMTCLARWSRYPEDGADDELGFPKGAIVGEARDVNGDWWFGTYLGKKGLFPGGYVRVLGD
jgi:hypothetical protein